MPTIPAPPKSPGLDGLVTFTVFQEKNAQIFPSMVALRWFYRTHRLELLAAGAVIEICGRLLIDDPVFSTKAREIWRSKAASRIEQKD